MIPAGMLTSTRADYCTPAEVFARVRKLDRVALDPCAHRLSCVRAARYEYRPRGKAADTGGGLALDWRAAARGGLVYVNPPYGRALGAWARKIASEASAGAWIVSLVPARVDTAWWRELLGGASAVCFWSGRVTFDLDGRGVEQPAMFPSALVHHGRAAAAREFARVFADVGTAYLIEHRIVSEGGSGQVLREVGHAHAGRSR